MTRKMFLALTFALLAAPLAAQAQPWTGTPAAVVVDESSTGIYQVSTGSLSYNASGSTSGITAYFNVTDTSATGTPGWTSIDLSYFDPGANSQVRAQLFRVTPSSTSTVVTCTSTDNASITTKTCSLGSSVDFTTGDTYVMAISVTRTSTGVSPLFTGVRLY